MSVIEGGIIIGVVSAAALLISWIARQDLRQQREQQAFREWLEQHRSKKGSPK